MEKKEEIISNKIKCKSGTVAVDGGKDYLKRIGNEEDYEDISEIKKQ